MSNEVKEVISLEEIRVPIENDPVANSLAMIERMASNPDVDASKLRELLNLQKDMMQTQSLIEFNQAMTRLMPKMPVIDKQGTISFVDKNGNERRTPFARYEDIDKGIRPFLIEEGFSLSFDTEAVANQPTIIKGTLSHKSGHFKSASMPLPLDTSGSKNNLQAMGSTISYGKRYLVGMLLNIVTKGEDDDGSSAPITNEQAVELDLLINETKTDRDKFLKKAGVDDIRNIPTKDYMRWLNALKAKKLDMKEKK